MPERESFLLFLWMCSHYTQIFKVTAMGTPVVVSYANIFMSEYEQCLLHDYEQRYKHKSALWLRFIDIFLDIYITGYSLDW